MRRLLLGALLIVTALGTGCAHSAVLANGECAVDFHAVRLNGSPVKTLDVKDGGHSYHLELSVFAYAMDPPLQAVQSVASITEPGVPWLRPDRAQLEAGLAQTLPMIARSLPSGRCEAVPVADPSAAPEGRCVAQLGGKTLFSRVRVFAGSRGLFMQYASWLNPKGQEWSDAFWASIRLADGPFAQTPAPAPLPSEVLAERLIRVIAR